MERRNDRAVSLLVTGFVAVVAIVALVLNDTRDLSGALSYAEDSDDYQMYCTDSDPANYFDIAGTVRLRDKVYEDHCEEDYLVQQYCRSWKHVSHTRPLKCENGCSEGVCL